MGTLLNTSGLPSNGDVEVDLVLLHGLPFQYLSGFLIGMGMGGVTGSSTLGVAMFSLIAPKGHLNDFTSIVPVVNAVSSLATISVYLKHANWRLCWRMWPAILCGIALGTLILPILSETSLRRSSSVIYGLVLGQQVYEKVKEFREERRLKKDDDSIDAKAKIKESRTIFYNQLWVSSAVSVLCGVITVVTNNSGPIFNVYLLACGLDMNEFVASRSVLMAGKNLAKTVARVYSGHLSLLRFGHGCLVGALSYLGVQAAKPIKRRISTEFYEYFTWCVLLYTCVRMWFA
mmetsp:Transcript_69893/g.167773  ORF Transcript_69893/g.167773 Transcript_69893/m.167773 type:complete len:289 (+) Transcript_69893:67-933(+)